MNNQQAPVDSELRLQLARRSAGRLPLGLLADVTDALDAVPVSAAGLPRPRTSWRAPGLVAAGLGAAFVAVLLVAIALPAFRGGPAATPPTPTPGTSTTTEPAVTPTGLPIAPTGLIGPGNKALTPEQLTALIAADPNHLAGRYTIDERVTCDGIDCSGFPPKVVADTIQPDGTIGLVGPVNVRPDGGIVWTYQQVVDALPTQGGTYIVDAWIGGATCCEEPTVAGTGSPQPDYESSWLGFTANGGIGVAQPGAYHKYGGGTVGGGPAIHGLFLFEWMPGGKCGTGLDTGTADTCTPHAEILARLETAVLPSSSTPAAKPTGPAGPSPLGLLGSGNRPLTQVEFASIWAADPAHLAGRIAIVTGPVPAGFECSSPGAADAALPSPGCNVVILEGTIAADGHYWAVRVESDSKLTVLGRIAMPKTNEFLFKLDELNTTTTLKTGDLVMVEGWLLDSMPTCNTDRTPLPSACGPYTRIESTASDNSPAGIGVQQGGYTQITGTAGDVVAEGPPVYGLFLVQVTNPDVGTVLARLEVSTAP